MNKEIFPKSNKKFQCIGPCYDADETVVHPITLEYITANEPFCPVFPWYEKNPNTGKKIEYISDGCKKTSQIKYYVNVHMVTPVIHFDNLNFLKMYYNITSLNDLYMWYDKNKFESYFTVERLLNCAFSEFKDEINIIDDRLINILLFLLKRHWIRIIYKKIKKYIIINIIDYHKSPNTSQNTRTTNALCEDASLLTSEFMSSNIQQLDKSNKKIKIYFGYTQNLNNNKFKENINIQIKYKIEAINFLLSKISNNNIMSTFLDYYISNFDGQWKNIDKHIKNMEINYIKYIEKQIVELI